MYPPTSDHNICWIVTGYYKISAKRKFLTQHWNNHTAMVKYTIATLQAMVSTNPTGAIEKIHECPTFATLCHLQHQLINGLHKLGSGKSPLNCHAGYILSK